MPRYEEASIGGTGASITGCARSGASAGCGADATGRLGRSALAQSLEIGFERSLPINTRVTSMFPPFAPRQEEAARQQPSN
jgi:hypothetical protein